MTEDQAQTIDGKLDQVLLTALAAKRAVNVRTLAFIVILVLLAISQVVSFNQGSDIKAIAKSTNGNSTAIKNATGPDAQARSAAGLIQIKKDVRKDTGEEIDCRSRRQQVRLPAPADPNIPCKDQTDASVYPGVAGIPARG